MRISVNPPMWQLTKTAGWNTDDMPILLSAGDFWLKSFFHRIPFYRHVELIVQVVTTFM
jgi:hypothetical protein